jgi:hypothetical protein
VVLLYGYMLKARKKYFQKIKQERKERQEKQK